jgi:hypothetical protein
MVCKRNHTAAARCRDGKALQRSSR